MWGMANRRRDIGAAILLLMVVQTGCGKAPPPPDPEVVFWTCPMHPNVQEAGQTPCPLCKMDLVPVRPEELEAGMVQIDSLRRQEYGIRTVAVEKRLLQHTQTALGWVRADERRVREVRAPADLEIVAVRLPGVGAMVGPEEPILVVRSPTIRAAQAAYLAAPGPAALERLLAWGMTEAQIKELKVADDRLELRAPAMGMVLTPTELAPGMVAVGMDPFRVRMDMGGELPPAGSRRRAGEALFRWVDLRVVVVDAELHESDLSLAVDGAVAMVEVAPPPRQHGKKGVPAHAGRATLRGPVGSIDPHTRRGLIRMELDNPDGVFMPGRTAQVHLSTLLGSPLSIPFDAVVHAGPRDLVFVQGPGDQLIPREVQLGRRTEDRVEVIGGLEEGTRVVAEGTFLVAAESRLRASAGFWAVDEAAHAGH